MITGKAEKSGAQRYPCPWAAGQMMWVECESICGRGVERTEPWACVPGHTLNGYMASGRSQAPFLLLNSADVKLKGG